jgi:predicted cupin superfamily sugar epimerase
MDIKNAEHYINSLELQPHPEGGYYKEVFRSKQNVVREISTEIKKACTSIYYLLENADFSGFHRIASEEIWYFHKGEPLLIHVIDEQGTLVTHELSDEETGSFSVAVPAGLWFAAEIQSTKGFTLVSCAVAPGFEFSEFEMGTLAGLVALYPQHASLLMKLCRQ